MTEPLKITDKMQDAHKARVDGKINKVNTRIKAGVARGLNDVCFPIGKHDCDYSEVRELFEKEGYRIVPTGYSGGVWQTTEQICW